MEALLLRALDGGLLDGAAFFAQLFDRQPTERVLRFLDGSTSLREDLAVRTDWKPAVDRVVTYEVVRPLPVKIGPIGPQVDPKLCVLLPGRWSQFQALVEKGTLRSYLKVLEVRAIR